MSESTRRIEYMLVRDLVPADLNPKRHDHDGIVASITRFGFTEPVLLDERTGKMIAGHGRIGALRAMEESGAEPPEGVTAAEGGWTLPVVRGWSSRSDADAAAVLAASNRLVEKGGWDSAELFELLDSVKSADPTLVEIAGWDAAELDDLLREVESSIEASADAYSDPPEYDPESTRAEEVAAADPAAPRPTLAERFLVPPFDVIDARTGWWRARKQRWINTGIRSELGRGATAYNTEGDDPVSTAIIAKRGKGFIQKENIRRTDKGLLLKSASGRDSDYYRKKTEAEQRLGRELSIAEFERDHYEEPEGNGGVSDSGTSVFDPVLCELLYRWFSGVGHQVIDPFAGGSVRGIVAGMLGRAYLGNDLSGDQVEANRQQARHLVNRGFLGRGATPTQDDPAALTPVERHGTYWVKRDDTFAVSGSAGGKVRTCLALASAEGVQGLVTAGSRQSPQVNIVAGIARQLGLPCRVHVPKAKERTPELQAAEAAGAEIVEHSPGYNTVIVARARQDAAERGWVEIPFGMECQEAVDATARQVENLPKSVKRLVVPVGSGMSLSGILHGLKRSKRRLKVIGVQVGADPTERLDKWAPKGWRDMVELVHSGLDYHTHAETTRIGDLDLDPVYESKCLPFLEDDDCLWVVGIRQTARSDNATPIPQWSIGDSAEWVKTLPAESADMMLTCPPYLWLERYGDDPADLSNMDAAGFERMYAEILGGAVKALRPNRFAAIVVGNVRDSKGRQIDMRAMTERAMEAAGCHLVNAAVMLTPVGSLAVRASRPFIAGRSLGRCYQDVMIFCKGERREAARACGEVDLTALDNLLPADNDLPDSANAA